MKEITRKIIELNLFHVPDGAIEASTSNHWEDDDHITISEKKLARLVLRISSDGENSTNYYVCLEVDEYDAYGEVFLNDSIWTLLGNQEQIIKDIQDKNWDLENLGTYAYLFK